MTMNTCRYRRVESHNCRHCGHCHVCDVHHDTTADIITQLNGHDWDQHLQHEDHKLQTRRNKMGHTPCAICGTEEATEWDHIIPRRHSGTDDPTNLQPACGPCNRAKSDRLDPMPVSSAGR